MSSVPKIFYDFPTCILVLKWFMYICCWFFDLLLKSPFLCFYIHKSFFKASQFPDESV